MDLGGIVGGIGEIAGGVVGGMFGGPIGAQIGSMIGGMAGDMIGDAMQDAGDRSNLPQQQIDDAKNALMEALNQYIDTKLLAGGFNEMKQNLSPFDNAAVQKEMDNTVSQMADVIQGYLDQHAKDNVEGEGDKEGKSWLEVLAASMGKMLGERAQKMMDASEKMKNAGDDQQAFFDANSDFQAQGQMFSMLNNAASNILKTIGQAINTMASKQ